MLFIPEENEKGNRHTYTCISNKQNKDYTNRKIKNIENK